MSNVISECLRSTNNINTCLIGLSNLIRKRECEILHVLPHTLISLDSLLYTLFSCKHVLSISALIMS